MRKGLLFFVTVIGLVFLFVFGGYAAERISLTENVTKSEPGIISSEDTQLQAMEGQPSEETDDIGTFEISEEVAALVQKSVSDQNRQQFEAFLKEFYVPKEYVEQILTLVKQGYRYQDIMMIYDFLAENYGSMEELTQMLSQQKEGETLSQLFDSYLQDKKEYTLKDFPEGEIDRLLAYQHIDVEDILIADIMAQEADVPFEKVMEPLTSGENWQQVAVRVGSLKCDGHVNKSAASNEEIDEYALRNNVSPQKAAMYVSIEKKTGKKQTNSRLFSQNRTVNSPGQMMANYLEEKYQ